MHRGSRGPPEYRSPHQLLYSVAPEDLSWSNSKAMHPPQDLSSLGVALMDFGSQRLGATSNQPQQPLQALHRSVPSIAVGFPSNRTSVASAITSDCRGTGTQGDPYDRITAPAGPQLSPIAPKTNSPGSFSDQGDHNAMRRLSTVSTTTSAGGPRISSLPRQLSNTTTSALSRPADLTAQSSKAAAQQPHLKKQQACLTCKRRKTRCDAVRPICGACSRSQARAARGHALTAEVPPGRCTYPDKEALHDSNGAEFLSEKQILFDKSLRLNKRLKRGSMAEPTLTTKTVPCGTGESQLSPTSIFGSTLSAESAMGGPAGSGSPNGSAIWDQTLEQAGLGHLGAARSKTERLIIEVQSREGGPSRVRRFYSSGTGGSHPGMSLSNLVYPIGKPSKRPNFTELIGSDDMNISNLPQVNLPQVDLLLRQMWPDLSPDLPTPDTIRQMAELCESTIGGRSIDAMLPLISCLPHPYPLFCSPCIICKVFVKHPCRTMFCKSTMMARLMLPLNHPLRPHSSLIHAILAAAEPFSPLVPTMKETNPSSVRHTNTQDDASIGGIPSFECGNLDFVPSQSSPTVNPPTMESIGRGFVGITNPFESSRPEIQRNISFGEFHLGKARREIEIALLTQNQRPLEWLQAGILVNYCLLERCRIMECFFVGACTVRTLAPVGFDKMPNKRGDATNRSMVEVSPSSIIEYEQRMSLWNVYLLDVYSAGPPKFYEPCIADEKEQITTSLPVLMDEVEDDTQLRLSEQTLKSDDLFRRGHTDTFSLHVKSACLLKQARLITSRRRTELAQMPRPSNEVAVVDVRIREFLKSFPKRPQEIDSDWIVAEANVCCAHITLHQHFVGTALDTSSTYGRGPIEAAVETMLRTIHLLLATSYDIALLHTQTFICWVVLVRVLEVKSRMLTRFWQNEVAQQTLASVDSVMQALRMAADRSWRAKTSLEICQACIEDEFSDDEFADLVYLWQVIPTS